METRKEDQIEKLIMIIIKKKNASIFLEYGNRNMTGKSENQIKIWLNYNNRFCLLTF